MICYYIQFLSAENLSYCEVTWHAIVTHVRIITYFEICDNISRVCQPHTYNRESIACCHHLIKIELCSGFSSGLFCLVAWHGMLCCAMSLLAVQCHAMPCHTMPCHAMPCCAGPCCVMPCHIVPCRAVPCLAIPCHAGCGVVWCGVTWGGMLCNAMLCYAML